MAARRQILQLSRRAATGTLSRAAPQSPLHRASPEARPCLRSTQVAPAVLQRQEQKRWHTTPSALKPGKQYDFSAVKQLVESPSQDVILLDVREPAEYEAGFIPTALNVPIASQPDAFHLPPDEFFDRFGFAKPPPDKEVVMYCKAGVRSKAAAQLAMQNGYERVGEYPGSWVDWEKNAGGSSKDPRRGVQGTQKV